MPTTAGTERGVRRIDEAEAAIVRRIFRDYAAGKSPRAIAHALNRESVPGPSGRAWGQSTLNGNWRRGTGILNNELYVGRLVWNRLTYIKNPDTGKRVSRLNPESEWITKDVPELRIVDDGLWERVKARQRGLHKVHAFHERQRPRMLLSFLLKCGVCGGGFSKVSQNHYGCSTARNKNTCANRMTLRQDALEEMVLGALRDRLMRPELLAVFCKEYTAHLDRLRGEKNASLAAAKAELDRIGRERDRLIQAIRDGVPAAEVKDDLARIAARREELDALLAGAKEEPVLLHPAMAEHYRAQVARLVDILGCEENRAEAADLLRGLIERIVLTPDKANENLTIDLHGDLAGILTMATNANRPLEKSDPSVRQVKMVAGARFGLNRTAGAIGMQRRAY